MTDFELIRSKRASISLFISPQGKLIVKAPHLVPMFIINRFVTEKKEWIDRHIAKVKSVGGKAKKEYTEGEEFLYLGKSYSLHIGNYTKIVLADKLYFPRALLFRAQKELTSWYIAQAKEKITKRVMYHAEKMHASYKSIMFSDTKSKWGSCGPDNSLQFNWRLIMTPLPVLDYVVIHELAHTTEKNHGDDFWNIVRRYTPAYKQHRKWVNENAPRFTI